MKNTHFLATLLFLAFAAVAVSFKTHTTAAESVAQVQAEDGSMFYAPTGNYYEYTYTKDTITNALNDTLYLPSTMRNNAFDYQASLSVMRTSLSGTANIAVKVEETNYKYFGSTAPTAGWVTALNSANTSAATAATTATTEMLLLPHTYGTNYRVIVDGTGTQSTSYVIRWVWKRKT